MKISLEWLSDYLPGPLDAAAAADALTGGGLPVELIEPRGHDTMIDVEVTSNRGDCLSHIGVARELAALLKRPFKDLQPAAPESSTPAASATSVRIDAPALCPHYTARIIRNLRVGPSPAWLIRRLEAIGLRPISNVVDITNYVMFEMGQPLHAFDFDRLRQRRIIVREARAGEKLITIDTHERQLSPGMLVIADAERPVALAGVMGGLDSEVTPATTDILLESARFDPLSVRATSRALGLMSDSSYRFERRIDPTLPERASLRAAQLILEIAGGELLHGLVSAGAAGHEPRRLSLRLHRIRQVLGIDLPPQSAVDALARLQLSPILHADRIDVTIPSWRLDLDIEVDLIEEVARVVGYDSIPVHDQIAIRLTPPDPSHVILDAIRSTLVSGGYYESLTFSFVSDLLRDDFLPPEAAALPRTQNVKWRADAHLRPSLLPGLLEAVRRNETAGTLSARLFEIGPTFWISPDGAIDERSRVSLVGDEDYRRIRGIVEELLQRLNPDRSISIAPDRRPGYAPGACGRIEWAGQAIGHVGRIHRPIAEKLSLRELPCAAEIELSALLAGAQLVPQLHPLPQFPAIRRDLSFVVAEATPYEQLRSLIQSLRLEHLEDLEYVTTYRGKPLEKGTKSITITLSFRSPVGTLTSEQVEPSVQRAIAAARQTLHATLRT